VRGEEPPDDSGIFVRERDELDFGGIDGGLERVEQGDFGDAGDAPGGPELDDHRFAAERRPVDGGFGRGFEDVVGGERRRWSAGEERLGVELLRSGRGGEGDADERQGSESVHGCPFLKAAWLN